MPDDPLPPGILQWTVTATTHCFSKSKKSSSLARFVLYLKSDSLEERQIPMMMNPYTGALVGTAVVSATVGVFVWRRGNVSPNRVFPLLMFAMSWWSLAYGLEMASTDPAGMRFWLRIEYLGIAATPVLWLLFAAQYAGKAVWLTHRSVLSAFVVPLITVLLVASNDLHHFYYRSVTVDPSSGLPVLALTPGPAYWLHVGYSYLCLFGGLLLILSVWMRSAPFYRRQAGVMLIGASIPFAVNIVYLSGVRPFGHLDMTPFAFTVTGLMVAFGLLRYRLFDLMPLARNTLLENLEDGIAVVDEELRIVEMNPAAQKMFGFKGGAPIGRPIGTVVGDVPELTELAAAGETCNRQVILKQEPLCVLDVRFSPVHRGAGDFLGGMMVLRDVTQAQKAEEALRKGNERLELLLHSLPQAVLVIDAKQHRIIDVNPQACVLIGRPADQIAGRPCRSFLCGSRDTACPITDLGKPMERFEGVLRTARDEEVPVLQTVLPLEVDGSPWLVECLFDLSEVKRAEMERVERERLQAIVETAGAVCHEMNQPLMAISGYGELCLMDLDPGHPARELIQKALNQAERMGQITRKLTHVTSYKTKEYLNGKILDIDSASTRERDTGPTF